MRIDRTKIYNVDRYLSALPANSHFRVLSEPSEDRLERAGFASDGLNGTTTLPSIVGRASRYNAEGRHVTRRDLPKEERYVGSREFTRSEWHGQDRVEVTDTVDYYRMCYPRQLMPPPSVELTLLVSDNLKRIVSPELQYIPDNADANRHIINLMLELFGSCEVVFANLERITPPATQRVNWQMLPQGEHPFERIRAHIEGMYGARRQTVVQTILNRQNMILAHRPDAIYRGIAGFGDYIAYIFNGRGIVALESVYYGNALYLLGPNWEATSRLTKAQIIQGELAIQRIVHTKDWVGRLAEAMRE